MKLLPMLVKFQKEVFDLPDEDLREINTEVRAYEDSLSNDSKSKVDQLYIKLHKGPWFRVFSVFIYMLLLKEFNKIMNPQTEEYDDRLNRYK